MAHLQIQAVMGGSDFEFELSSELINDCSHPGPCDADVARWMETVGDDMRDAISFDDSVRILKPYGAWDAEELTDYQTNLERILWLAAGSCKEEGQSIAYLSTY